MPNTPSPEYVIESQGLTRYYGSRQVVAPLDLKVPRGCIYGFLGRNGAGKSTTIRMLLGLVEPTRGSAQLLGCDSMALTPDIRARVGYLAEGHHVYGWMTVSECAKFQKDSFQRWNEEVFLGVIEHFGLKPNAKASHLSRGERAGLCLALTLAPEPELLILDDPALGLDPVARRSLLQSMIFVTRRSGQTVFFSSHLLSDVERVADRIAVLDHGVLRAECSLETFRARVRQFALSFDGELPSVTEIPGMLQVVRAPGQMTITVAHYDGETDRRLRDLRPTRMDEIAMNFEDALVQYLGDRGKSSFFLNQPEATV